MLVVIASDNTDLDVVQIFYFQIYCQMGQLREF